MRLAKAIGDMPQHDRGQVIHRRERNAGRIVGPFMLYSNTGNQNFPFFLDQADSLYKMIVKNGIPVGVQRGIVNWRSIGNREKQLLRLGLIQKSVVSPLNCFTIYIFLEKLFGTEERHIDVGVPRLVLE